ncbi:MAG: GNAT family N-acetyltransferase [Chloroflexota bacterium]
MTHYSYTRYDKNEDLQTLIDVVSQRPPERIADYPSAVDLHEMLGIPEPEAVITVWRDESQAVVGFAMLDEQDLRFDLLPSDNTELALEIVAWATNWVQSQANPNQTEVNLTTGCVSNNTIRLALLKQLGFEVQDGFTWYYSRSLSKPIPDPKLPAGFTIRPLAGETEVEAHVMLHRAAYGTENMTVAYRLSMMQAPDYIPELDLIAVAPNGQLAAYTMGQISEQENALSSRKEGLTDPVATHPDYQGRGIAKALILTGLKLLQQQGMETANLGTWHENIAMQRTAEAAGFEKTGKGLFFRKSVPIDKGAE